MPFRHFLSLSLPCMADFFYQKYIRLLFFINLIDDGLKSFHFLDEIACKNLCVLVFDMRIFFVIEISMDGIDGVLNLLIVSHDVVIVRMKISGLDHLICSGKQHFHHLSIEFFVYDALRFDSGKSSGVTSLGFAFHWVFL